MGIIDTYSEYSLYDIINDEMYVGDDTEVNEVPSVEYRGLHIIPNTTSDIEYLVQPDAHAGEITRIDPDEYEDVLELVDELNGHATRFWVELTDEERVEEVGPMMTHDRELAEESELYTHVPEPGE